MTCLGKDVDLHTRVRMRALTREMDGDAGRTRRYKGGASEVETRPLRKAAPAAAERELTPSLFKMLATCPCAVRQLMNNASPISLSVKPLVSRWSTSISRGVRSIPGRRPAGSEAG